MRVSLVVLCKKARNARLIGPMVDGRIYSIWEYWKPSGLSETEQHKRRDRDGWNTNCTVVITFGALSALSSYKYMR
jgi:hypothetical protein